MLHMDFRRMLRRHGTKVGHGVFEFATPGIGQIMAAAGADFAFIDMEHTGFDVGDIKRLIVSLRAGGVAAMVRPPSHEMHHQSRVMDIGADALIVSNVSTPDQAKAARDALKYPPMGKRAVAVQIAHDRYRPATIAETIRVSNRRTALITMIETEEGLANVEAIAAVKDVDCLWLGHFDLSTSLGIPGQFEHPKFVRAVNRIVAAGRRNGISLGRLVTSPEGARAASRQGFDTLCYDGDIWLYHKALSTGLAEARKACAPSGRGRAR